MARRKINVMGTMSSATVGEFVAANAIGIDYVSIACFSRDGAWNASLVVTIEVSPDGDQWYTAAYVDMADGTSTNVPTFTANGIKRLIPVLDVSLVRARVTTAGGTTTIVVNIFGQGEDNAPPSSGRIMSSTTVGGTSTGAPSGSGGDGGSSSTGSGTSGA